ncbi:MAG: pyruvate, phosphate dikinase [Planctomycetota bacterium]|nr:pyruvate, phosphate dikinase [Planctomycetota bacterium]
MEKKHVYSFGQDGAAGAGLSKELLGGKGRGLAEMTSLGLCRPPRFHHQHRSVLNSDDEQGGKVPADVRELVLEAIEKIENEMGAEFGDSENPLLVSVRSGAAVSMPGMMDTVLNLGLTDVSVEGLSKKTDNPRMAWDAYRRLIQMFGDVAPGIEEGLRQMVPARRIKGKGGRGGRHGRSRPCYDLEAIVAEYKKVIEREHGSPFPQSAEDQLWAAIDAVFGSWNNKRAIEYRKLNDIRGLRGTAVNVQAMVYGNYGDTSGTGVCFTRNPSTGENKFYGEYLINAQGEDVVAGIRTPKPISTLHDVLPEVYDQLVEYKNMLESHFRDMQDIEFTIQEGKLFILQTRTGKRTAFAAIRIAVEMVEEEMINEREAVERIDPNDITQLLLPQFDSESRKKALDEGRIIAKGLPASPGAAVGKAVFDANDAVAAAERGEDAILIRVETSPVDVMGMAKSKGILTSRGGMTSHAAVVARGMGRCCVSGSKDISINEDEKFFTVPGTDIKVCEGEKVSLDGFRGEVMLGEVTTVDPEISGQFETFMSWVGRDSPAPRARQCRDTDGRQKGARTRRRRHRTRSHRAHVLQRGQDPQRSQMILANTEEERRAALDELLPHQQKDFESIFRLMNEKPVTIRTLDPPLHEFLPNDDDDQRELAKALGVDVSAVKDKVNSLHETNPMLGHRGCRLGITYPEITEMQVRAIFQAAVAVKKEGIVVYPEIMIPLVGTKAELADQEKVVRRVAKEVIDASGIELEYLVGTMIEIPRAALTAEEIAEVARVPSLRHKRPHSDGVRLQPGRLRRVQQRCTVGSGRLLSYDPFQVLDQTGVGQLVEAGVTQGRAGRANLKCGICGEHGGEPQSVKFCHRVGLDYVSCSPFRVPVARVAAAQAAVETPRK